MVYYCLHGSNLEPIRKGYLIDRKLDEWDRETWGPIKNRFEQFKTVTKPFRDIPAEILASFKVPDLEEEFDRTVLEVKQLEQESNVEPVELFNANDEEPPGLGYPGYRIHKL